MADVPVTPVNVPLDVFSAAASAATSLTAGDVAVIAADGVTGKLLIEVTNTTDQKDVTVHAGVGERAALGDLVLKFGATQTRWIAVESARFGQADGTILVEFEGAGSIRALRLPPGS